MRSIIGIVTLLRDGVLFRRLTDPLHMGKSTVQECELLVRYSPRADGLHRKASRPITDILYTDLRPLNIRRLGVRQNRQWCILLTPSYSLYKVVEFDHIRRIIKVSEVRGPTIPMGSFVYTPYKCYENSWFNYGRGTDTWRACVPEFVTYITFDMLPDIKNPLVYIRTRKRGRYSEIIGLIFISRPKTITDSVPVLYTYDCRFVWIGATLDDLHDIGFSDLPTNYTIEKIYGRKHMLLGSLKGYSLEDFLENTSVTRAIKSYALVNTYIETLRETGSTPQLITYIHNIGLRIRRVPKICFKKVLLGASLRATTTMLSSAPIFINIDTSTGQGEKGGGIGVRIVNSECLEFLFDKNTFRKLIEGIIYSNIKLFKTLFLKYLLLQYCYDKQENYYDFYAMTAMLLDLIQGGKQRLKEEYYNILYAKRIDEILSNLKKIKGTYEKFIEYVVKVALYSLAHLFAKILATHVFNTRLENFTLYTDLRYKTSVNGKEEEYYAILVLENSHEGLGFIEQLCNILSKDPQYNVGKYLVDPALEMLIDKNTGKDICYAHYEEYKKFEEHIVNLLCKQNPYLNKIRNHFKHLVEEWSKQVDTIFPSDFARSLLFLYLSSVDRELRKKLSANAFLRNTMPMVYNVEIPFCWDGCLRCLRLRQAYILSPIEQIFYISKGLIINLLKVFKDSLVSNKSLTLSTGSGLGSEVLKLLEKAKHEIRIMSPWLSPEIAQFLINIASSKNVKIRILTHSPSHKEPQPHSLAISVLKKASRKLNDIIKIMYNDKIHAKMIIIDDRILITGSMNLTKSGTEINIENISICDNKALIYSSIVDYETQWMASTNK